MLRPTEYIARARARCKRALRNRGRERLRCFLEPGAWRGSVRDVYRDLRWTLRARRSPFEEAEIAFIQKDDYDTWVERRRRSGASVALNQLPHVSRLLVAKAPLARLVEGRSYALETFVDASPGQRSGIWVQKPSEGGCGTDIVFLRDPCDWQQPGQVLQRYLDTPYLIEGRKCDVRIMATIDDRGELRIHPEGLIKCASEPFDIESLDPRIHNSNGPFQKREGLKEGPRRLLSQSSVPEGAVKQMSAILADIGSLLHARGVFRGTRDFELLGVDFLIDDDQKVWLLEINQHPGWRNYHVETGHFFLDALDSLFD